jgi:hypothetical protein
MKIWKQANGNASRFRWSEGELIEDPELLALEIYQKPPQNAVEPHWKIRPGTRKNKGLLEDCRQPNG